jgi:hypothetical protein
MEHNCINVAEIATIKNEVKNIKEQMSDLSDIKNSLTILTTLQTENEKRDVERDEDRKKQSEALIALSETPKLIARLDKKFDLQNDKLQIHDEKIIAIDTKLANQSSEKTNKLELTKGKMVLYGVIITAVCSSLTPIIVTIISKIFK